MNNTIYNITMLRPGGNDTALIQGLVANKKRKYINDAIMRRFPTVEQVGFYDFNKEKNLAILEMAGGEFCGNAVRSLAYLLLGGKVGTMDMLASGTKTLISCGVKKGYSFAQVLLNNSVPITMLENNIWKISFEGIVHLVTFIKTPKINKEKLKNEGITLLDKYDLLQSEKASGVIFVTEDFKIFPIVWVRDIQTLFLETACGTGTAAVGIIRTILSNQEKTVTTILQPSGMPITATVFKEDNTFLTEIYGSTTLVKKENIQIPNLDI